MILRSIAPALALLVLASGCSVDADREPLQVLVGDAGSDVYVAIVADDTDMVLYACDGTADAVTITEWFQGPHDDGRFELESARTTATVTGTFDDQAGTGSLFIERSEQEFSLEPARSDAGLYFDEVIDGDTEHWAGWIVHPDGSIRGSVLNRKTDGIVAAGNAAPSTTVRVSGLDFQVLRLEQPVL